jgi:hypothetical protein
MNPEKFISPGMRPADLLLYLFGNRGAIERVAATRHAWIIGAILVLTAGIARNYDHLDLLREPEWFIGPFAASLVSIVFIFLWISGPLKLHKVGSYWKQLGNFLVLAWLTAPCAWIYGIPVESMTDIMTATKWNIAFLGIVAFWRVAIIVRAVSVLTEVSWLRALPLVLAPAALEAMLGSMFQRLSLVGIMGGIRLPPHTELLVHAANFTNMISFWLCIAMFIAAFLIKGIAQKPLLRPVSTASRALLPVTALMFLAWVAIAIPLQPQISNRYRLLLLLDQRNYSGAITFASGKTRQDFPRHHYLPPEPSQWFPHELLDQLPPDAPAWLRDEWINGAIESRKMSEFYQRDQWRKAARRYPEIPIAIARHAEELRSRKQSLSNDEARWLRHHEQPDPLPEPTP